MFLLEEQSAAKGHQACDALPSGVTIPSDWASKEPLQLADEAGITALHALACILGLATIE